MRVATLQLDSALGDVEGNIKKADALLICHRDRLEKLDLLVLPELVFAGYNHKSFTDIEPYLEITSAGPSTSWAQRTARELQCIVAVGYAEKDASGPEPRAYNALVFVDKDGSVTAHTRKSFLYYTDETWASEGQGFHSGEMSIGPSLSTTKVASGICMDMNPYKFQAPWTSYEFANHALAFGAELVVLSMAWLTRLSAFELQAQAKQPDLDTVSYWLERMRPLLGPNGREEEVLVVFANRCGEEGESPVMGPVRYAGSSTVMGISRGDGRADGDVRIWDMMGRAEEGLLVVDTKKVPKYGLRRSLPADNLNGDQGPTPLSDHE